MALLHKAVYLRGRVQLRKQYVQKQHEFVFALHRAKEPHLMDRSPDDALRYQSVMFALIRALDKVNPHPHPSVSLYSTLLVISPSLG